MNLKAALAGFTELREETPAPAAVPRPTPAKMPAGKLTKSTHPDFDQFKVYLRRDTRRAAERKWEDADGGDFSDLVEHLLRQYLGR